MARFNKRFISNRKQGHKQTRGQALSASRKRTARALKGLGLALEASKTNSTIAQVQQRRFVPIEQAQAKWHADMKRAADTPVERPIRLMDALGSSGGLFRRGGMY